MISFKAFTDAIRQELWPFPGEPQSLLKAHTKFFMEAMVQVQKWVPQLQVHHTTVHNACSTYVTCGLTATAAPNGRIRRVYTIANGEWCDAVFYSGRDHREVLEWKRRLMLNFVQPANAGMPALQQGFKFVEAASDSPLGRARTGIWSIDRDRLYVAPWLQSNESLVVEWDGTKALWSDEDLIDDSMWDAEAAAVVKLYVQKCHERDFGCDQQRKNGLEAEYQFQLGNLKHSWRLKTENQENCDAEELNVRGPTIAERNDDEPPAEQADDVAAFISDYANGPGSADVAALVKSWDPSYIVTGGDNWYGSETTLASLDEAVGEAFSDYIYPYLGSFGTGADRTNNFHPGISNHDRDPDGRLAVFLNYFNLRKPYYDVIRGNTHWFFIDGGYKNDKVANHQPDGNSFDSVQGEWLKLKLSLSTARWKIVVTGFPPYTSSTRQYAVMRWPFKQWGADLVMSGDLHVYERLNTTEGYPLIIAGFGGYSLDEFGAVLPYSAVRYNANYGAVRLTLGCNSLKLEAINRAGVLVDTYEIIKP